MPGLPSERSYSTTLPHESASSSSTQCQRVREALLSLGTGAQPEELARLKEHIESCEMCQGEMGSVERLLTLAREALTASAPPEVCHHLDEVLAAMNRDG